jgi:DNA polymerase
LRAAQAPQVVFGAGNPHVQVMLVGEQPGDDDDKQGRPFVDPAGRLLDRALGDAGIAADATYVTNAFSIFAGVVSQAAASAALTNGQTPQLRACGPWLIAEIERSIRSLSWRRAPPPVRRSPGAH